jgi:hypothetical protein
MQAKVFPDPFLLKSKRRLICKRNKTLVQKKEREIIRGRKR